MIKSSVEFGRLRTSENPDEYHRATSEEAVPEVWLDVIRQYPEMRIWVAHNKTVPIEILEILAKDGDPWVRSMVASKRKLPPRLQLTLGRDEDSGVRNSIACNAKAAKQVLELLAGDNVGRISERAAGRLDRMEHT
jgi:hypothetical protein